MAQRVNTTAKKIISHYEVDLATGTPKLYSVKDSVDIVMSEFGGRLEYTSPDNYLGNNEKHAEYSFDNGLKVWAGFKLNEFKQYQLNHIVLGS